MIVASWIVLAIAAVPTPREQVSVRCATAVTQALAHQLALEKDAGNAVTEADIAAKYSSAGCVQSSKEPGRTFVFLLQNDGVLRYSHRIFVVNPSGEVTVKRSIPCDESPNPEVCG